MGRSARALLLAAGLALAAAAPAAAQLEPLPSTPALARAGLVDVRTYDRTILVEARYAGRDNFTGRRLPGYCRPWAFLERRAARRLARVQRALRPAGLGLKVWDGYRPARASRAMVRWARRTGNDHLLNGYIAARSNHARGTTVDLTLVRLAGGEELDMGTGYDDLSVRAHTLNARGAVLGRRLRLRRAMAAQRFASYRREWWHFDGSPAGPRRLDVPLGCSR